MNNKNLALLLLRIGVGLIFVLAGWGKLTGIENVQSFFGNVGIPLAGIMAWVVALVEFVGGLMVLIGYKVKIPSLLLAFIMIVAILTVKLGGDGGFSGMRVDIMLLVSSSAIALLGSGGYSVEGMLNKSPEG